MADWIEIANTLINLQNQQRLGDISRAQQQTADHLATIEYQKQHDQCPSISTCRCCCQSQKVSSRSTVS